MNSDEIRQDAFHGTTLSNALSIVKEGFRKSRGILGTGAYFDLGNDQSSRFRLARLLTEETKVIIQAEIDLGTVLDLGDKEIDEKFRQFQKILNQRLGTETPRQLGRGWQYDEFLSEYGLNPDTLRKRISGSDTIAVRSVERICILSIKDLEGREIKWQP